MGKFPQGPAGAASGTVIAGIAFPSWPTDVNSLVAEPEWTSICHPSQLTTRAEGEKKAGTEVPPDISA